MESGELDALVKDAKSTNQRDRDELLEARSIYSGALQAKTSEDVFNYLGDNYIAVTCKAGYFVQFSLESRNGVCTPCFPGTFTSGNAGENFHKCAGQCPEGYTSSFGSRSEDSCFPLFTFMSMNPSGRHRRNDERRQSFGENSDNTTASASINAKDQGDNNNNNVQRLPSNLRSCEGAVDTTGNVWNNRGFAYITSKDECEEAARLLHRLDVFTMTVTKVEERCSDINYLTGETDLTLHSSARKSERIKVAPVRRRNRHALRITTASDQLPSIVVGRATNAVQTAITVLLPRTVIKCPRGVLT